MSEVVIPAFYDLPAVGGPEPATGAAWFLLAQVKENMTLTKPTLIVTDRRGVDFAVTFEAAGFDLSAFRKGRTTLVVPGARRTDRGEGKKAIVAVPAAACAAVRAVPAPLDRVLALGARLSQGDGRACAACDRRQPEEEAGAAAAAAALMRCTGCGCVRYCSKVSAQCAILCPTGNASPGNRFDANARGQECQIKGWSELGHKGDCKALKAMKEIQGIGSA